VWLSLTSEVLIQTFLEIDWFSSHQNQVSLARMAHIGGSAKSFTGCVVITGSGGYGDDHRTNSAVLGDFEMHTNFALLPIYISQREHGDRDRDLKFLIVGVEAYGMIISLGTYGIWQVVCGFQRTPESGRCGGNPGCFDRRWERLGVVGLRLLLWFIWGRTKERRKKNKQASVNNTSHCGFDVLGS
jgi:hypothetical protein